MKLNQFIKYQRKKKKLTLMKLSQKANISYGMLYRLEDESIKKPKPELLKKVSEALDVDYEDLLSRAGYLEGVNYELEEADKKEYSILEFDAFLSGKVKEVLRQSLVKSKAIEHYILVNNNNFIPYFKQNSILGLRQVSGFDNMGKYLVIKEGKVMLVITKNNKEKNVTGFIFPNFYTPIDVDSLVAKTYKILLVCH